MNNKKFKYFAKSKGTPKYSDVIEGKTIVYSEKTKGKVIFSEKNKEKVVFRSIVYMADYRRTNQEIAIRYRGEPVWRLFYNSQDELVIEQVDKDINMEDLP